MGTLTIAQWVFTQLKYAVFQKVTACSADGRKLRIKLYIFYLPLYENIRRAPDVFNLPRKKRPSTHGEGRFRHFKKALNKSVIQYFGDNERAICGAPHTDL